MRRNRRRGEYTIVEATSHASDGFRYLYWKAKNTQIVHVQIIIMIIWNCSK